MRPLYIFLLISVIYVSNVLAGPSEHEYYFLGTAYTTDANGDKAQAYKYFEKAMESDDCNTYDKACQGAIVTAPLRQKYIKSPYYATFYAEALFMKREFKPETSTQKNFKDFLYNIKVKVGRHLDKEEKVSAYIYANYMDDTNSQNGLLPEVYSDNSFDLGLGISYRPWKTIRFFAENGIAYNFLDNRTKKIEYNYRLGVEYFKQWGAGNKCSYEPKLPLDWFSDLYVSATYYNRYKNTILQAAARAGIRLFNYKTSSFSAYARVGLIEDTENLSFNNILEVGPGISWQPDLRIPATIRAEYRHSRYFKQVESGETSNYNSFLLYALIYFEK